MRLALATILLVLLLVPSGAAVPAGPSLAPCVLPGDVAARCGHFSVPENRAKPGGRTISLRIAVVPARNGDAAPDAIVDLMGGPGGSAVANAAFVPRVFRAANATRDIVLVDQRGTGGSRQMRCSPPRSAITTPAAAKAYAAACVRRFAATADVTQYTTAPAMDDLADVLRALGYESADLYGGSYGATAAQYFLVRHPDLVRTAVLDGATLLDVPIFERWSRSADTALRGILDRCARTPACGKAYPRVRREVFEMVAALRRAPLRTTAGTIDAATAEGTIQALSRADTTAAEIPWIAHEFRTGNPVPLELAVEKSTQGTPLQVMFWSIVCQEPWARRDPRRASAASRGTYLAESSARDGAAWAAVCAGFPRVAQPAWSGRRPASDAPILFLVGGSDPQDPLANVAGAATTMPRSRTVVVPGAGHGSVQLGCVPDVVNRFVATAAPRSLDVSCVRRFTPAPFILPR